MSAPLSGPREIAAGMADALRPALAADAPPVAVVGARDVAQLMGLAGLDAALAELERHAGAGRPVEVDHLAARIARLADAATAAGDITAFHAADPELQQLAAQLAATDWRAELPPPVPAVATLTAGEALADLHVEFAAGASESRLTMTVASALRAAIDWLGIDEALHVRASVHDAALTITAPVAHAAGVGPAGAVLGTVEGSLGAEADGPWTLRVPLCAERPAFLLVRQGRYGFALPWHAVSRLRMFAPAALEQLPEGCLPSLGVLASGTGERPAALLARGLVRAWFVADRIVWRIAAVPREAETAPPFAGAGLVVEVEGSEPYWVLDPAWLLRNVTPPAIAPPALRPRAHAAEPVPPAGPSALAEPVEALPPAPRARADEGEPNAALADAVERALGVLRRERIAQVPPPPARASVPGTPYADAIDLDAVETMLFGEPPAPPAPPIPVEEPTSASAPAPEVDAILFAEPPATEWHVTDDVHEAAPAPPQVAAEPAIVPAPPPAAAGPASPPAVASVPVPDEPVPAHTSRPSELAERVPARRALIADDSLVARIFLARLLEKRGWIVESVADAAGLWSELHRGPWTLVCADFAMPDAQGHGHISRLLHHLTRRSDPATCVVLTRDGDEERIARDAGATYVLRKPFDADRLDAILGH